ncbi:MAG: GNAT family N-acetyltransferase [Fibrella sp.]|nr:GNAT family N-acetyltransferase [Armatimonadota bacterium]
MDNATKPDLIIRTVTAGEAAHYNDFFRGGVLAHPESFRVTAADFADSPFDPSPSPDGFTLVATANNDAEWLGVVSVEREPGRAKRQHVAWLVRMYVAGFAAGRGLGRRLVRTAVARSKSDLHGVEQLNLTVLAANEPAKHLYASEGFAMFAHEPDALRGADGVYQAEEQMRLSLKSDATR